QPRSAPFPYTTLFRSKKVKTGLSAGRVQSVAVRLVVERELEIRNFKPVSAFKIEGTFLNEEQQEIAAKLKGDFKKEEEAENFLRSEEHTSELQSRENL